MTEDVKARVEEFQKDFARLKAEIAKEVVGYDEVIDYSGKDTRALIKELRAATGGGAAVNGYFDNAGGPCTEATLMCLAQGARVAVCGQIAYYNLKDPLSAKAYPASPRPSPFGQPVWSMKPSMTRWKSSPL